MKILAHSIDMVVLSTHSETIQNRDSILCPSALATKPTWVLPANLVNARPKISPCEKLRNLRVLNDSVYKSHSRGCSPAAWSRASRPCYPWATGHNTMKNKFNGRLWKIDIQKNHVPPNWLKKLISDLSWNSKILALQLACSYKAPTGLVRACEDEASHRRLKWHILWEKSRHVVRGESNSNCTEDVSCKEAKLQRKNLTHCKEYGALMHQRKGFGRWL